MSALPPLPDWLSAGAAGQFGAAPPAPTLAAALPGYARAQGLAPIERLQALLRSRLSECSGAGEPVHQAWRRFLRGSGPSTLVVDATAYDPRDQAAEAVLVAAPWLLAEGLVIAAGLRDTDTIELRLPPKLTGREAPLLNAADAIRELAQASGPRKRIVVLRDSLPSPLTEPEPGDTARLVHSPETWCRIARLFAGATDRDRALLTLRRGAAERGLVELDRSGDLRGQIDLWTGGTLAGRGGDPVIAFDDGMGGFLPLSATGIACDPLSLAAAGVAPAPATAMVMAPGDGVVEATRRALFRHWELAEDADPALRGMLARAARLTAEIALGRGDASHLSALGKLSAELTARGLAAAAPLTSALRHFRAAFEARLSAAPLGARDVARPAAPCHSACPANIDIPSFMAHLGRGDHRATIAVIRKDNPLPLTCGLVCPAPCESACVRGAHDAPVHIRPLKAKAAELCLAEGGYPRPDIAPDTGKRIGIVGSGPSSLTVAYYLRTRGHHVEVFEAQPHAGGQLRYGIPAYRLPPDLLEQELDQIRVLGVAIHTSAPVANLELFRRNYDAVYLGVGTQKARLLPIEGVHHPFVQGGLDFLHAVRSGAPVVVGPRVVVVGGGNVAIDVALTALRQGAREVDMVCLEKRREMPASPHEIEEAAAEGVRIRDGWGPLLIDAEGLVTFQRCERVKDDSGAFNPNFDAGRTLKLEADDVLLAAGQGTDLGLLEGGGVQNLRGFIVADPATLMTDVPGVFAGGDAQRGPRTAVEAIRAGKIAAAGIDAWLVGAAPQDPVGMPVRRAELEPLEVSAQDRTYAPRVVMPERSVEEVLGAGNYVRIEEGLTDAMAQDEVRRCLRCDVCIGCGLCMVACSEMGVEALRMGETGAGRLAHFDYTRAQDRCIGCGACAQVCPTGAIHLQDVDGLRRTIITGTIVKEQPLLTCADTGAPTFTPAHRDFVRARLPVHMAGLIDRGLSPAAARAHGDRPRFWDNGDGA